MATLKPTEKTAMIFSRSAEYALRVMAYLALREDSAPLRAKDLAKEVNIPVHYSSKILGRMVAARLLLGSKGHGGGFYLRKKPQTVKFIDIFEAIEGPIDMRHCVFGLKVCSSAAPCPLHHRWSALNEAFQKWARETTLADVQSDVKKLGPLSFFTAIKSINP
jgi:Rrf2 family protein